MARALQCVLRPDYLYAGVDAFLLSLPPPLHGAEDGVRFVAVPGDDGRDVTAIEVGPRALALLRASHRAMAAIACDGVSVLLDEVLLSDDLRQSYRQAFDGLPLMTVKVHCSPEVADERERARGDRMPGLASGLAALVHEGMVYDAEVETSTADVGTLAAALAADVVAWRERWHS